MSWLKLGRIFNVDSSRDWMMSHASLPFLGPVRGALVRVYFSTRDKFQVSSVGWFIFDMETFRVLEVSSTPALSKGALGCFDDSGVMGSCLIQRESRLFLYYVGWNLGTTVPFRNSIGLAESVDGGRTFRRLYDGPIIDRNRDEPHFAASCDIFNEGDCLKIWYTSCVGWSKDSAGEIQHRYHIKCAESIDGIRWKRKGDVAIDFSSEDEFSISSPRVIPAKAGGYKMWYSFKRKKNSSRYRIGVADSIDGKAWIRRDAEVGIDLSPEGWDSEMIEYPFIYEYSGKKYMFYNGNNYGKSGIGLAIWSDD